MTSAESGAKLLAAAKADGFRAFGKLLSWLERTDPASALALPELVRPARTALRVGITGPPGAGKSTLVSSLLTQLRARDLTVGVLAVDPSSPFSRGAVLGDRIRYVDHTLDPKIFIRSLGTRGSLGGLSGGAFLMARAFDACAFDVLLIETVGVGQTELDVLHVADRVMVVLTPESGDGIQVMKAGLTEIADLFVVNKADRPGADGLARELEHARESTTPIYKCVATSGEGVPAVTEHLLSNADDRATRRLEPARLRFEAKALRRLAWEAQIEAQLRSVIDLETFVKSFGSSPT